jgi:hypothetical protein
LLTGTVAADGRLSVEVRNVERGDAARNNPSPRWHSAMASARFALAHSLGECQPARLTGTRDDGGRATHTNP